MKNALKKFSLACLFLISVFGIVSFVNGSTIIDTNPEKSSLHKLRLHSLYLLSGNNETSRSFIKTNKRNLDISTGLVVGNRIDNYIGENVELVMIGGGKYNEIKDSSLYVGIAGGKDNEVDGELSVVGGGEANYVEGSNSVIVGGSNNAVNYVSSIYDGNNIIVGGDNNQIENNNSIILGGRYNNSESGSLIMGKYVKNAKGSFVWNNTTDKTAPNESALIYASSGVLIGTLSPITGVNLVVSGAVKVGKETKESKGKIFNSGGCINIYYSTGKDFRTIGIASETSNKCKTTNQVCKFGKSILQIGDATTGYNVIYSKDCTLEAKFITCTGSSSFDGVYPYCYEISDSPFLDSSETPRGRVINSIDIEDFDIFDGKIGKMRVR